MSVYSTPSAVAAFTATALISLAPNLVLLALPSLTTTIQSSHSHHAGGISKWLILGQAMGAGGLLADVFLHTLSHHGEAASAAVGWDILLGFVVFFAVDLLVRSLTETSPDEEDRHIDHHIHGNTTFASTVTTQATATSTKRSLILLNLVADALHNFTDGMAIGATYALAGNTNTFAVNTEATAGATIAAAWMVLRSHARGGLATLSILFHEIPHEISDFCTLVRAGYSTRQAIMAQLATAIAAMAGTAAAISVSTSAASSSITEERLVALTAGGFVYLAATTILPEVLKEDGREYDATGKAMSSTSGRFVFRFAQLAAFGVGIGFLAMVATLDGHEHHHGAAQHHHDHHHRDTLDLVRETRHAHHHEDDHRHLDEHHNDDHYHPGNHHEDDHHHPDNHHEDDHYHPDIHHEDDHHPPDDDHHHPDDHHEEL